MISTIFSFHSRITLSHLFLFTVNFFGENFSTFQVSQHPISIAWRYITSKDPNNCLLPLIMQGNAKCRQIPWMRDDEMVARWKEGRTGYPFIDAIMTQLRVEGWIHHLARHAVACFLTRGDLWQHWEEVRNV